VNTIVPAATSTPAAALTGPNLFEQVAGTGAVILGLVVLIVMAALPWLEILGRRLRRGPAAGSR
jgi:hypothetical protein